MLPLPRDHGRQEDLLDRHLTVEELVAGTPYPAHAPWPTGSSRR